MTRCGCNPILEPFEFPIFSSHSIIFNNYLLRLIPDDNNTEFLKEKIILEYLTIIDKLECGIQENLEFLLEEISLINILEDE